MSRVRSSRSLALFDIDGTLTDTVGLCDDGFAEAVAHVAGVPPFELSDELWHDATDSGLAARHFELHTGRPATEDDLRAIRERFIALLDAADVNARPVPGARTVLEEVAARDGWQVGIATGNWRAAAAVKFRWAGMTQPDLPIGTADDAHARVDILRVAIARASERACVARFDRIVYFGDGTHDVHAARALQAGFVAVTAVRDPAPLRAAGAGWFLGDFLDLQQVHAALEGAPIPGPPIPETPLGR